MHIAYLAAANSVHTLRWVNEMADRGFRISLISMRAPLRDYQISELVHCYILRIGPSIGYLLNAIALRRLLITLRPDMLHTHYASGYGTLARLSGFRPRLLSTWGSDVLVFPHQ